MQHQQSERKIKAFDWDGIAYGFAENSLARAYANYLGKHRNIGVVAQIFFLIFLLGICIAGNLVLIYYGSSVVEAQQGIINPKTGVVGSLFGEASSQQDDFFSAVSADTYAVEPTQMGLFVADYNNVTINSLIVLSVSTLTGLSMSLALTMLPYGGLALNLMRYCLSANGSKPTFTFGYITAIIFHPLMCGSFLRENKTLGATPRTVGNSIFVDRFPFLDDLDGAPKLMAGFKRWLASDSIKKPSSQQIGFGSFLLITSIIMMLVQPITLIYEFATIDRIEQLSFDRSGLTLTVIAMVLCIGLGVFCVNQAQLFFALEQTALLRGFAPLDAYSARVSRMGYLRMPGIRFAPSSVFRNRCLLLAWEKYRLAEGLSPMTRSESKQLLLYSFVKSRVDQGRSSQIYN